MHTRHVATTANTRALYPFVTESGLGSEGIKMGLDENGGEFFFDEWVQYLRGVIRDLNSVVFGIPGYGKTSWLLTKLARNMTFRNRWARVLDPKGEYYRLVQCWNEEQAACEERARKAGSSYDPRYASHIRLAPGGTTRINPVDPAIPRQQRITLVVSIANAVLAGQGRLLEPVEIKAIEIALDRIDRERVHTLPAIVEALIRPHEEAAQEWNLSLHELEAAGRNPGFSLGTLTTGALAGMFDGETSSAVSLNAPLVVLDLSSQRGSGAMGILMLVADTFIQAKPPQGEGLLVMDEAHEIMKDPSILRGLSTDWKFCRMGAGTAHVLAAHGIASLKSLGDASSLQVALARTLLADSSTRVLYHTDNDQAQETRTLLGLSYRETALIQTLQIGKSLQKVGNEGFEVEHVIFGTPARDGRPATGEWRFIDPTSRIAA
jgi:type IV secretory pathway VirB4 component